MHRGLARLLWRALALLSVLLGLIGIVLPGLPTVPFLLLAAWAGGKGWPVEKRKERRWGKKIGNGELED